MSILYIRGINKHTKVRNIDCVRASSLSCVNPFQEKKLQKSDCSSIVLKIDVYRIIKYDAPKSVYFPRYLLQTPCKSDTYYRNYQRKSYLYRRSFSHNPPLLLLFNHVIPCREGDGPYRGFGYFSLFSDPIDLATWSQSELL